MDENLQCEMGISRGGARRKKVKKAKLKEIF
jgi:hypothetical protein